MLVSASTADPTVGSLEAAEALPPECQMYFIRLAQEFRRRERANEHGHTMILFHLNTLGSLVGQIGNIELTNDARLITDVYCPSEVQIWLA